MTPQHYGEVLDWWREQEGPNNVPDIQIGVGSIVRDLRMDIAGATDEIYRLRAACRLALDEATWPDEETASKVAEALEATPEENTDRPMTARPGNQHDNLS
jgi:hypothetical protein